MGRGVEFHRDGREEVVALLGLGNFVFLSFGLLPFGFDRNKLII